MLETWLLELIKGIGKLFINPLFYWGILLFVITGYKRIRKERAHFGMKVNDIFTEGSQTFMVSLLFSIIISFLAISFGIIFSFEIMAVLVIVMFLLSITGSTAMLSASYTIGISFILLLILPFIDLGSLNAYVNFNNITVIHFICIAILTGLFLLVESILIGLNKNKQSFPALTLSERGIWIGEHHLKKLAFIPFFALIPTESITGISPFWPYFEYGSQSFSLILFPFFIGYHYKVRSELPELAAGKLAQSTLYLSLVVLAIAIGSLFYPFLSFVAIFIALLGKEWMTYRHRMKDRKSSAYFTPLNQGVKVLTVMPNSPADRLGILVGETILKVNGQLVTNSSQFYEALQNSGAFFKLDILDYQGEVRFVNSAFYEEDHHELGVIFAEDPNYFPLEASTAK